MPETGATAVAPPPVRATILLVEDNPDDILLVQRAIKRLGVRANVAVVEHGDAAIDYLSGSGRYADRAQHPLPDVVLLDLKLPRRSGHEVLDWVRRQPALDATPVVIMTSSTEEADVRRAYRGRANSYLRKPVAFADLESVLQLLGTYWLATNVALTPGRNLR